MEKALGYEPGDRGSIPFASTTRRRGGWELISPPLPLVDEAERVRVEQVVNREGRVWMLRTVGVRSGAALVWCKW